jgi:hypothetical protein
MVDPTSYTKGATSFLSFVAVAFLLGLSLYSYHAQELLVCWLFLGLMFVALALIILMGVLGYYAGKCVDTSVPITQHLSNVPPSCRG